MMSPSIGNIVEPHLHPLWSSILIPWVSKALRCIAILQRDMESKIKEHAIANKQ